MCPRNLNKKCYKNPLYKRLKKKGGVKMPLTKGKSKAAFNKNVAAEVKSGKPIKQALAIAYSVKRKAEGKKK